MSCLARVRPVWIIGACLAPLFAPPTAAARGAVTTTSVASVAPAHGRKKSTKRRKSGNAGKIGSKIGVGSHTPGRPAAVAHRRDRHHPAGSSLPKPPTTVALVTSPGPAQTPAALRAMDEVRRMQIERAENAARRDDLTNRWETVNFLISGVDEQRYPQAGFWKVLSCYRRGRISEGDSTRQRCRLSASDIHALDGERSVAMLLSEKSGAPALEATALTAPAARPEGVVNNAAYTGPGPTADDRTP